jgi:hypothetical protein
VRLLTGKTRLLCVGFLLQRTNMLSEQLSLSACYLKLLVRLVGLAAYRPRVLVAQGVRLLRQIGVKFTSLDVCGFDFARTVSDLVPQGLRLLLLVGNLVL